MDETVVIITGSMEMKAEAASLIAEKIATFRYATKAFWDVLYYPDRMSKALDLILDTETADTAKVAVGAESAADQ